MSRQYWNETLAWATAAQPAAAVASSASEALLVNNVTIPANYMQDGRCLRLQLFGGYGTTGTPTIQFWVRFGGLTGTILAKSSLVTTTSGVGGGASMTALWAASIYLQVRTNGATGTIMTNGVFTLFTSTAATAGTVTNYGLDIPLVSGSTGGTTPATASPDFTADTALAVTVQWGTSNAANSIQTQNYTIEALN